MVSKREQRQQQRQQYQQRAGRLAGSSKQVCSLLSALQTGASGEVQHTEAGRTQEEGGLAHHLQQRGGGVKQLAVACEWGQAEGTASERLVSLSGSACITDQRWRLGHGPSAVAQLAVRTRPICCCTAGG